MTFRIEGTTIYLTRGDTLVAQVGIKNNDGTSYDLQENDVVKFALKSARMKAGNTGYADIKPLIQKTVPHTLELRLEPADTKNLPFAIYKYDLELTHSGIVDTFINNADFHLLPEVCDG